MKLALGTAQFGLDYGVSNSAGQTSATEVQQILSRAKSAGIDTVDTASAYGSSEDVLGQTGVEGWRVVSKIPPLSASSPANGKEHVRNHINESLRRLKIDKLYGLLLHRAQDLLSPQGEDIAMGLQEAKAMGLVGKIGYSIYAPEILTELTGIMQCDLIQAPLNVVDQRLLNSGWLSQLAEREVEIHIRSVFMQGLLLMNSESRPQVFDKWQSLWQRWDAATGGDQEQAIAHCLGFAKELPNISRIIVGVESESHLAQLLDIWDRSTAFDASSFSADDPQLIDPSNWKI